MPATFVKVGGSVITRKAAARPEPRGEKIRDFCCDVKEALESGYELILAHGGGSFAHPIAQRYGLREGLSGVNELGFSETRYQLTELSQILLAELVRAGVPAVVLHPSSFIYQSSRGEWRADLAPLKLALRFGLTPVLLGDVVFDEVRGCSIFSADDAPMLLRELIDAAVFLVDVGGVLDGQGSVMPKVGPLNLGEIGKVGVAGEDVTGRMREKVLKAIDLAGEGVSVRIAGFNRRGDLRRALKGQIGTEVVAQN